MSAIENEVGRTISVCQSRWVPTLLKVYSGAPLGPVGGTLHILPQARVQSQCRLSTSLLSAVRVWVTGGLPGNLSFSNPAVPIC